MIFKYHLFQIHSYIAVYLSLLCNLMFLSLYFICYRMSCAICFVFPMKRYDINTETLLCFDACMLPNYLIQVFILILHETSGG